MEFLDTVILGNDLRRWLLAVGVLLGTFLILRQLVRFVVARAGAFTRATRTRIDDVWLAAARATRGFFSFAVGVYVASRFLTLAAGIDSLLQRALLTIVLVQVGLWAEAGLVRWLDVLREERYADDAAALTTFNLLGYGAKATVWFLAVVFALQTWGVNVTALITGLGIGGVAVALAVQSLLADLFASASIIFDKPFLVGDFLVLGDYLGTVEAIGMKTTRLRSLSGEQLIISNGDLLRSRVRNYGRMSERRAVFSLGVTYETPPPLVQEIPSMVREIIEGQERARFDRCHFKRFGDFALEFETVYYMTVPDYGEYMDVQEAVNLELLRRFSEAGIEFAYPTQLVYVTGTEEQRPAASRSG